MIEQRRKILIWLIVLLIVLNAVTIGTIFYHNYNESKEENDSVIVNTEGQMINGRYMRQNLAFDNDQIDEFRNANHRFRPMAFDIVYMIDSLKIEMFAELKKADIDTVKLNDISNKIGGLHGLLKQETFRFYLKIKSICNAEQKLKLETVFTPLFKNEGINMPAGPYNQSGWRRGNGYKN